MDWAKPIEAVRWSDGRIFPVRLSSSNPDMMTWYTNECPDPKRTNSAWKDDGNDRCIFNEWYIRNRVDEVAPTPTPEHAPKTLRVDGPQGVMVIPRTIDEWDAFCEDVQDKHWSFTLDVLDALGLIIPDDQKPPLSRAERFEEETGIRAGNEVLAALEWAANNPE